MFSLYCAVFCTLELTAQKVWTLQMYQSETKSIMRGKSVKQRRILYKDHLAFQAESKDRKLPCCIRLNLGQKKSQN